MNSDIEDWKRSRNREKITPELLAAERADSRNRRRRATPRTAQEQARVEALRELRARTSGSGAKRRRT
jgi:hypothetical protein